LRLSSFGGRGDDFVCGTDLFLVASLVKGGGGGVGDLLGDGATGVSVRDRLGGGEASGGARDRLGDSVGASSTVGDGGDASVPSNASSTSPGAL
jgi:hypothetical protein